MSQTSDHDALHESAVRLVLRELDPGEARSLEDRLAHDPALADEVRRLRATLDLLPHAARVAPPPSLRGRVLRAGARARRRSAGGRRLPWSTLGAIAAALVALVLGVDGLRLRRELALQQEVTAMLQEPNVVRSFRLAGIGGAAGAWGSVKLDLDERKGAVALHDVPELASGEVYRLWARVADQDVPCGDFGADAAGRVLTQFAVPVDSYQAPIAKLFVTVERRDGPPGPSERVVMESA